MLAASAEKTNKHCKHLQIKFCLFKCFGSNWSFCFVPPLLRFVEYDIGGTSAEDTEVHTSKPTEQSHFLGFGFWPFQQEDVGGKKAYTAPQFEMQYSPPGCRIFSALVKRQNKLILHIQMGEGFTWAWNKYIADLFPG